MAMGQILTFAEATEEVPPAPAGMPRCHSKCTYSAAPWVSCVGCFHRVRRLVPTAGFADDLPCFPAQTPSTVMEEMGPSAAMG